MCAVGGTQSWHTEWLSVRADYVERYPDLAVELSRPGYEAQKGTYGGFIFALSRLARALDPKSAAFVEYALQGLPNHPSIQTMVHQLAELAGEMGRKGEGDAMCFTVSGISCDVPERILKALEDLKASGRPLPLPSCTAPGHERKTTNVRALAAGAMYFTPPEAARCMSNHKCTGCGLDSAAVDGKCVGELPSGATCPNHASCAACREKLKFGSDGARCWACSKIMAEVRELPATSLTLKDPLALVMVVAGELFGVDEHTTLPLLKQIYRKQNGEEWLHSDWSPGGNGTVMAGFPPLSLLRRPHSPSL